jgi:hypothetical protein
MACTHSAHSPLRLVLLGVALLVFTDPLRSESQLALIASVPEIPPAEELATILEDLTRIEADRQRQKEEEYQNRLSFFQAIADGDKLTFSRLLSEGLDPDSELPFPPPPGFSRKFEDELLRYYVSKEPGLTGLMVAAAMGNHDFVKLLLASGAQPYKTTKRHKTFALWLAGKYQQVEIMQTLLGVTDEISQYRIVVELDGQHAYFWKGKELLQIMPISSGRKSHPTPQGKFVVTNKYTNWKSTLYHAKMPYFLRLSCGDFGLHAGNLPGYPASHGCIRLPPKVAKELFAAVPIGTLVEIR